MEAKITEDVSRRKISKFRSDASIEWQCQSDKLQPGEKKLRVIQDGKTGKFKMEAGKENSSRTLGENMDRAAVFEKIDQLGLPVEKAVDREWDLGDFKEPVVSHTQSTQEKEIIFNKAKDMKPGDELSYTLPNFRISEGTRDVQGETITLACVEKGRLQYVPRDLEQMEKSSEEKVPMARRIPSSELTGEFKSGNVNLKHRPNQLGFDTPVTYALTEIKDVKMVKGKYNEEEIEALKAGKPVDYDKIYDRNPIKDKEAYISHVLKENKPDFTHGENTAFTTMKEEWDSAINKEELEIRLKKEKGLSVKEDYNKFNEKIGLMREAQRSVIKAKNTDRLDAIIGLRRAAKQFERQGKEWRKLSKDCKDLADKLTLGNNLEVIVSTSQKRDENLATLGKSLKQIYPDINKGLGNVNELRSEKIMEEFQKKQKEILEEQLKKQQEKAQAKEQTKPKAKGLQRKPASGRSLER